MGPQQSPNEAKTFEAKQPTPKEKRAIAASLHRRFRIHFEGPVLSSRWPDRMTHLFTKVQEIGRERYEECETLPSELKNRMGKIMQITSAFRNETQPKEREWRTLENNVFSRFNEFILCTTCDNENFITRHQAEPYDDSEKQRLKRKLEIREKFNCVCQNNLKVSTKRKTGNRSNHEEHEYSLHFRASKDCTILRDENDELSNKEKKCAQMEPDKVIGFWWKDHFKEWETILTEHESYRVSGDIDMYFPFLVLEAKSEVGSPGFRSIEAQTAFPIKRLLELQKALEDRFQAKIDPTVWFFANQGEIWRVYAGTLDQDKQLQQHVRVYELWIGNVESRDGALQVCQIADFIWSWARDVYRRQITKCLVPTNLDTQGTNRSVSTSSTNPRRSVSVAASAISTPTIPALHYGNVKESQRETSTISTQEGRAGVFTKAYPHSPVTVVHSNIVNFTFQIFQAPDTQDAFQSFNKLLSASEKSFKSKILLSTLTTIPLRRRVLVDLQRIWMGGDTRKLELRNQDLGIDEIVRAFCFIRFSYDHGSQQLRRELHCILWTSTGAEMLGNHVQQNLNLDFSESSLNSSAERFRSVQETLIEARDIVAEESVAFSLEGLSLVLLPKPSKSRDDLGYQTHVELQPLEKGHAKTLFIEKYWGFRESLSRIPVLNQLKYRSDRVLRSPKRGHDSAGQMSILCKRFPTWPSHGAQFCLFLLVDLHNTVNPKTLDTEALLQNAKCACQRNDLTIEIHPISSQDSPALKWSNVDKETIRSWTRHVMVGMLDEQVQEWRSIPTRETGSLPIIDLTKDSLV